MHRAMLWDYYVPQFGGQIGSEGSWRQKPVRRPTCKSAVGVGRREWQGKVKWPKPGP